MALWKAVLSALLLLVPTAAPARGGEVPPDKRKVVIEHDDLLTLEGDEPLVLRVGRDSRHGYLGVHLMGMNPELREHFGAPRDAGVLVSEVEPESPAGRAGIQVGDIITKVDGEKVDSSWELSRAVRREKAGESLKLDVVRDRAPRQLTVTVEERERRESDLGDLRDLRDLRRHRWIVRDLDSKTPLLGRIEDLGRLRDRVEELEKKVKELEKRIPAR